MEPVARHKDREGGRGASHPPGRVPQRSTRQHPRESSRDPAHQVFSYVGKWSVEEPSVLPGIPGDMGLVLKTKAAHHAISAPFDDVFDPKGKTLVVSYEVKLQKGLDCGGAYIKLLTDSDEVRRTLAFLLPCPALLLPFPR